MSTEIFVATTDITETILEFMNAIIGTPPTRIIRGSLPTILYNVLRSRFSLRRETIGGSSKVTSPSGSTSPDGIE
jgi:hypothetical protein